MANPAVFNQPTVPVQINIPANQLPQPVVSAANQQRQQQQPIQQPQPQQIEQPKSEKLPPARYLIFPWKQKN